MWVADFALAVMWVRKGKIRELKKEKKESKKRKKERKGKKKERKEKGNAKIGKLKNGISRIPYQQKNTSQHFFANYQKSVFQTFKNRIIQTVSEKIWSEVFPKNPVGSSVGIR